MAIEEYENNKYIKKSTELEDYLLRIVHRYFKLEEQYTRETKEAIIVESVARYKESLMNNKNNGLFSLNKRTGNVVLSINDFNGEPEFNKKGAFNKNFCSSGVDIADTICEGNDLRLSDNREPINHLHSIASINGLNDRLDYIKSLLPKYPIPHFHTNNYDTIEKIRCSSEVFDLKRIEDIVAFVQNQINVIDSYKEQIIPYPTLFSNRMDDYVKYLNKDKEFVNSLSTENFTWITDTKSYINASSDSMKSDLTLRLNKYLKKSYTNVIKDNLDKKIELLCDVTMPLSTEYFARDFTSIINPDTNIMYFLYKYHNSIDLSSYINDGYKNIFVKSYLIKESSESSRTELPQYDITSNDTYTSLRYRLENSTNVLLIELISKCVSSSNSNEEADILDPLYHTNNYFNSKIQCQIFGSRG